VKERAKKLSLSLADLSLYNLPELRRILGGLSPFSASEILREGFARFDTEFFSLLEGDFAFVLEDPVQKSCYAVRDPLGLRPLYYTYWQNRYRFASDIETLLRLPGISKRPDRHAMKQFLDHGAIDYERTFYAGIHRIPPAHYLKITPKRSTLHRYWFPESIEIDRSQTVRQAAEKFRTLLLRALERRLESAENCAFELSGGLDSSSLVSLAATRQSSPDLPVYSLIFPGMECDESPYLKEMERFVGCAPRFVDPLSKSNFPLDIQASLPFHPHWPQSVTFSIYLPMLKQMQMDNRQIIISGQGGDHLLGGSCYLLGDLLNRGDFSSMLREVPALIYAPFRVTPRCFLNTKFRRTYQKFRTLLGIPISQRTTPGKIRDLFGLNAIESPLQRHELSQLFSASESTLRDGNIFHSARKYFHLEYRHPFFDKALIEFLLSLPPEYKYSRGWSKVLLRYTLSDQLPPSVLSRRDKAEFSPLLLQALRASDTDVFFRDNRLMAIGLVSPSLLKQLRKELSRNAPRQIVSLWRIFNLEYWYRYHFD